MCWTFWRTFRLTNYLSFWVSKLTETLKPKWLVLFSLKLFQDFTKSTFGPYISCSLQPWRRRKPTPWQQSPKTQVTNSKQTLCSWSMFPDWLLKLFQWKFLSPRLLKFLARKKVSFLKTNSLRIVTIFPRLKIFFLTNKKNKKNGNLIIIWKLRKFYQYWLRMWIAMYICTLVGLAVVQESKWFHVIIFKGKKV